MNILFQFPRVRFHESWLAPFLLRFQALVAHHLPFHELCLQVIHIFYYKIRMSEIQIFIYRATYKCRFTYFPNFINKRFMNINNILTSYKYATKKMNSFSHRSPEIITANNTGHCPHCFPFSYTLLKKKKESYYTCYFCNLLSSFCISWSPF